jgi:integrase
MPRQPRPWQRKDRNNAWYVTVGGTQYRLADGSAPRKEVEAAWHALMASLGRPGPEGTAPAELPLLALCNLFLDDRKGRVDPSTFAFYKRFLGPFSEAHGTTAAVAIRPYDVTKFLADRPTWNSTTKAGAVTALKACFRWGKRQGLISTNPIADVERPRAKRRDKAPVRADVDRILAAVRNPAFLDLATCLLLTGCRPAELYTLTADRVLDTPDGPVWRVRDKIRWKTGEEFREVYPGAEAHAIARRWAARFPTGPIFRNARGNPWQRGTVTRYFREIRRKLGIGDEAVLYGLRHLYVTDGLMTKPLAVVAGLVGHRDPRTTLRVYGHAGDRKAELRAAAAEIRPPKGKKEGQGGEGPGH